MELHRLYTIVYYIFDNFRVRKNNVINIRKGD